MLLSLNIKNVVLIDKLQLDFAKGLTVFTGETGAGKSMLLDSLALVLGERAESSLVRNGEKSLQVVAVFDIAQNERVKELLKCLDIDADEELLVKRTVTSDGKSRAYVNDVPVTLNALRKLSDELVEIHGQFMTHGLLDSRTHIDLLDEFGGYDLTAVKTAYADYQNAKKEYDNAISDFERLKQDEDYLKHNLEELENFDAKAGEYEELAERISLAANSERIFSALKEAHDTLNSENLTSSIRSAQRALLRIDTIVGDKYKKYVDMLDRLEIDIRETVMDLSSDLSDADIDPASLDKMQERHYAFKSLAKKHGVNPEDLAEVTADLREKISKIDSGTDYIVALEKKVVVAKSDYEEKAAILSKNRKKAAATLDLAVMSELPSLKLGSAKFKTEITVSDEIKENGIDEVRFKVITNVGGKYEDLAKIASGGELSRFMLALKVNLVGGSDTVIFDEVDAGIGGATANAVGARLKRLGTKKQVLVVTHSPQVASFGTAHLKVRKFEKDMNTYTTAELLGYDDRIDEIARMLSGKNITDASRDAAIQMVIDNERT